MNDNENNVAFFNFKSKFIMDEIKKNQDELSEEQLDKVSGGTRIDPNSQDPGDPPKEGEEREEDNRNRDPEKEE